MTKIEKSSWEKKASNFLKSELIKRGSNYEALSNALAKININKTKGNLTKTINQGKFSFVFFLQCAKVLGIKSIPIDELIQDIE